eukprot:scaffold5983_cov62-Cyclotella_meneghiniana.AAC.1
MASYDEIRDLCYNFKLNLPESELVLRLKSTRIDPGVLATTSSEYGFTLLHDAAMEGRSPEFCKVLIELRPTLVKTRGNNGRLPVHTACAHRNVKTAKYLLEIYPESVNIATPDLQYPLHLLAIGYIVKKKRNDMNEALVLFELLLKHDQGALTTTDEDGFLPLHLASYGGRLAFVKLIFDANPEAVFRENNYRRTPLDVARHYNKADVVSFFESQVKLVNQAIKEPLTMHLAFQRIGIDSVSLGAIKLAVKANPAITTVTDSNEYTLLHLAYREGNLGTVKCLVELDQDSLKKTDAKGNLALHHACLGGWCDIVIYILGESSYGVTMQNLDKKLPIKLLLCEADCDRNSLGFTAAVDLLLRSCPDTLLDLSRKSSAA